MNYYVQLDNKIFTDNRKFWKAVRPILSFQRKPFVRSPLYLKNMVKLLLITKK